MMSDPLTPRVAGRDSVMRLQAELDAAYRAGQEAMRERCVALCRTRLQGHLQGMLEATDDCTHDQALGMADEAEECAEAIRALEVE